MEGFVLSTVINRPIEEVFTVLADLVNDLKWRSEWVDSRKISEGPIGIGSRFSLFGEAFGRRIETEYETIKYEPNRIASWKTVKGALPLTFQRTVEPVEGGTKVHIRYETEARGFLRLILSLLAGSVKRQHEGDLRKLKELMESGAL